VPLATTVDSGDIVNYGCEVSETPTPPAVHEAADPGDGLRTAVALRQLADRLEAASVEQALDAGWSWSRIAEELNVSRQAVHKKHFPRLEKAGAAVRKRRKRV
jgi:hypothetical protein